MTDAAGDVLNSMKYGPFGETPALSGTPFGYTGQRYDAELQAYYYKARYYSPEIGRFLSPDPIGFDAGDMNLYAYVGNDAVNLTDPAGLVSNRMMTNNKAVGLQGMLPGQSASVSGIIGGDSVSPVAAPPKPSNGVLQGNPLADFNPANFSSLERGLADAARAGGISGNDTRSKEIRSNFRHAASAAYYTQQYGGTGCLSGYLKAA